MEDIIVSFLLINFSGKITDLIEGWFMIKKFIIIL